MTDFGAKAAQSFGKRTPTGNGGAPRPGGPPSPPKSSDGGGDVDSGRDDGFVPTKLSPILFAGVAVAVVQLLMGQILGLNGPAPPPGSQPTGFTSGDVQTLVRAGPTIAFFLFALIYQGCHLAAFYAMPAHFVLRWLKFRSLAAYAAGGLCASFVLLSLAAVQGDQITWATGGVELVGGALAGVFYRLFAGVSEAQRQPRPSPQSVAKRSLDAGEPGPT